MTSIISRRASCGRIDLKRVAVGGCEIFHLFLFSLVAKVSRNNHQDTAPRPLLGHRPSTRRICVVLSESIAPVPCMHTARAPLSLFLVLRASTQPARFYFCLYTQVIDSALAITVTSARSRRARKYFLYTCAHTHTFAPPAPAATQGSPLLGVGWTVAVGGCEIFHLSSFLL